jgi:pilus assembly protein CpaD
MFATIVADVPGQCGNFPTDLASGPDVREWANLPYENFGCATQKMLAAQVDDPRDLARARAVTEPDVEMRLRAIDDVRKGQDPGTTWKIQNTAIGQVGGS